MSSGPHGTGKLEDDEGHRGHREDEEELNPSRTIRS